MKDSTLSTNEIKLLPWGATPHEQTRNYISTLASGIDKPVLWVVIRPGGETREQFASLDAVYEELVDENWNHQSAVYVAIQISDGTGRKKENIIAGRVVAGDADGVEIAEWHKPPTMTVQSKAGLHPYYVLKVHASVEATEKACQGLAHDYQLDPAATDPQRVLRVPGFFHWKDVNDPFLVSLLAPGGTVGATYANPAEVDPEPELTGERWGAYKTWTTIRKIIDSDPALLASESLPAYRSWAKKYRDRAIIWCEYVGMVKGLRKKLSNRSALLQVMGDVRVGEAISRGEVVDLSYKIEVARLDAWLHDHPLIPWTSSVEGDEWRSRMDHAEFSGMAAVLPPADGYIVQDCGTPDWETQRPKARVWVARIRSWEARHTISMKGSRNPGATPDPGPHPGGFDPSKIGAADIAENESRSVKAGAGDLTTLRIIDLCRDHGWLLRESGSGWSDVTCPWSYRHTAGSGDTAGVKRGIDSGGKPGAGKPAAFNCFHSSCLNASISDFIRYVGRGVADSYCDRKLGAEQVEAATARTTVADCLGDAPEEAKKYVVPSGWRLADDGIYRMAEAGEVQIAPVPMLITGTAILAGDNSHFVTVAWPRSGRWTRHPTSRQTIADRGYLLGLSKAGAPVTSNNAPRLVEFLSEFEAANATTLDGNQVTYSKAMGWIEKGKHGLKQTGFLLGNEWHSPGTDVVRFWADEGQQDLASACKAAGSVSGWLSAVKIAQRFPLAGTAIYSSLGTPLLRALDVQSFALEWSGVTSGGKTTTLKLAASPWGVPEIREFIQTWDTTQVGRERLAQTLCDLPLLIDDTQQAGRGSRVRRAEDVTAAIYQLVAEKGRTRGSVAGMQPTSTWKTIVHSTGERPATSFDPGAGGAGARVLTLWGRPFGDDPTVGSNAVNEISEILGKHHGQAGREWLQWILKNYDREAWKARYRAAVQSCINRLPVKTAIGSRLAKSMGLIVLTEELAREAFKVHGIQRFDVMQVWDQIVKNLDDTDRPRTAYVQTVEWATAHPDSWFKFNAVATHAGFNGLAGRWDSQDSPICWFKTQLERVLQELGFPGDATVRTWLDRGWLDGGADHHGNGVRLGGKEAKQNRMFLMKPEMILAVCGADVEEAALDTSGFYPGQPPSTAIHLNGVAHSTTSMSITPEEIAQMLDA